MFILLLLDGDEWDHGFLQKSSAAVHDGVGICTEMYTSLPLPYLSYLIGQLTVELSGCVVVSANVLYICTRRKRMTD